MSQAVDREGTFRGQIISYALQEAKSGALAVQITARLDEFWNGEEWDDWREYDVDAQGYIWIIKKDGSEHQSQVTALVEHAGWDAYIPAIATSQWQPTPCQFVVGSEPPNDYHADTQFRINWINGYDAKPTGGNVDADRAKALQDRYGARLRALAGNAQRNTTKPKGKPATPPKAPEGITAEQAKAEGADEIPF